MSGTYRLDENVGGWDTGQDIRRLPAEVGQTSGRMGQRLVKMGVERGCKGGGAYLSLSSIERYVKARGKVAGNPEALII